MFQRLSLWPLLALSAVLQAQPSVGSTFPGGLGYLPPRPDNTVIEVGAPAIAVPPVSAPLGMLLPAIDPPPSSPPSPGASSSSAADPQPPVKSCTTTCPFNYEPVCGTDGVTYTNDCTFAVAQCRDASLLLNGIGSCGSAGPFGGPPALGLPPPPPPPPSPTSPTRPPVVIPFPEDTPSFLTSPGSGVLTYPPTLGSLVETAPPPRPLLTSSGCNEACTKIFDPLCGTDGVTYNNKCLLEVTNCRGAATGLKIEVAFEGTCESASGPADISLFDSVSVRLTSAPATFSGSSSSCDRQCTKIFNPVCGSDDLSYNSPCLLEVASCESVNSGGSEIVIAYEGQCDSAPTSLGTESSFGPADFGATGTFDNQGDAASFASSQTACSDVCPTNFSPVCGTDDETYSNECLLNAAACRSRSAGGVAVVKAFDGPCVAALPRGPVCDQSCVKTFLPVCGSDGETYNNICLLNLADCLSPFVSITYQGDGPCGSSAGTPSTAGVSGGQSPSVSIIPAPSPVPDQQTNIAQGYIPPV